MPRLLLAALATLLLILPATAEGHSGLRLRGTVALKSEANDLVTVRTQRNAVALRVPGSMSRIHVGQQVELRGSTLRAHAHGSRVLARNVSIVSSQPLSSSFLPRANDEPDDDEVEIKGLIRSLAPLTVESRIRSVTCAVPTGMSLAGFAVGDFVEITCDRIDGTWTLRTLHHEDLDDDDNGNEDDDDSSSGPSSGDEDDGDHSGPGGGGDDD